MNKQQTIIASIVEVIVIFAVPYLNRHGFSVNDVDMTDALYGLAAFIAYCFTNWKNHNYTAEANESQIRKKEDRLAMAEEFEEGDE